MMNSASSARKAGRFRAAGLTGVNETNCSELMKLRLLLPQGTCKLSYQCAGTCMPLSCLADASLSVLVCGGILQKRKSVSSYQLLKKILLWDFSLLKNKICKKGMEN